ncbi:MAG TPA: hypothetical protein VGI78_22765 [Acetobacteraceae bacterium]
MRGELRDHGFRLRQDILRLERIERGCRAAMETISRDLQRLPLLYDVLARDIDLLLQRADSDIGRGNVAQQSHQHIVVGGDRGQIRCIGRFHAAAELAPQIHLPGNLGTERSAPVILEFMLRVRGRIDLTGLVIAHIRANLLRLRVELADRNAKRGARFEHPGAGGHQSEILPVRQFDQPIQRGVVERRPPLLIVLTIGMNRCVARFQPAAGNRRGGRGEVRADLAGCHRQQERQYQKATPVPPIDRSIRPEQERGSDETQQYPSHVFLDTMHRRRIEPGQPGSVLVVSELHCAPVQVNRVFPGEDYWPKQPLP